MLSNKSYPTLACAHKGYAPVTWLITRLDCIYSTKVTTHHTLLSRPRRPCIPDADRNLAVRPDLLIEANSSLGRSVQEASWGLVRRNVAEQRKQDVRCNMSVGMLAVL